MEKQQLIKFIAKVMEDSGFKVYKNYKTIKKTVDIYAVLPSSREDYGVVVACKNYEKEFEVGLDVLEEMTEVKELLGASKITVVTTSSFSPEAISYSELNNIKLVDRQGVIELAEKYKKEKEEKSKPTNERIITTQTSNNIGNQNTNIQTAPITDSYDEQVVQEFMESDSYPDNRNLNNNPSIFRGNSGNSSGSVLNKQDSSNRSIFGGNNRPQLGRNTISRDLRQTPAIFNTLRPLFSNTIFLIILVTIIAYLIAKLLVISAGITTSVAGVVELLLAIALSYGIILFVDRDGGQILVKGTVIFFVSLILLMILTIAL